MYSKTHMADFFFRGDRRDRGLPEASTTMTSPGSTSRSKVAPRASSAQDSEAKTMASPTWPMHSGRIPRGSRAAISFREDMMHSE